MKQLTLLLIASFFISMAQAQEDSYSFKESYATSAPFQLEVSSSDGNIEVSAGDGNKVEVFYIVRKNNSTLTISRAELEKDFVLEVTSSASKLTISIRDRHDLKSFQNIKRTYVNFKITVPTETSSQLRTADGNVAVSGIHGSANVKTGDGNIHLENIKGTIETSTGDGNIVLAEITGSTSVTTSDGDISFKNLSGSFHGVTSDGNIRGNLIELTKELSAKTGDGNIDVTVPDHLGLDLNIRGESLKVPLSNFSGRSDESVIQGKSNGGGIAVTLSTSDGHISLTYL